MEKEKLYDKWTATGLETIKACVEDKIANYCELNKKQCQEVLNLINKQQKEIEFYKIQELGYIQGYEDGKSRKQTAVAIKNENAQYELIKRVIEEKDKEIEKLKSKKYILNAETNEIKEIPISDDYISKDKIREIISKYVDIEEHLVYHHQELWGADLAEMIKELLGE